MIHLPATFWRLALLSLAVCVLSPVLAKSKMPPDFVDAAKVVPGLALDMRYAGSHNFTGAPVPGYGAPRCWLTRRAASALAAVQADLGQQRGLGLKVFDCYRPQRAVRSFGEWAKSDKAKTKPEFFPDVAKTDLFKLGYIAERSAHSRGSTVDLTIIETATGRTLDMGTPFDLFGPKSHTTFAGLPRDVAGNRAILADAMRRHGFLGYDREWWHFTLADEPYPQTSFDIPIE